MIELVAMMDAGLAQAPAAEAVASLNGVSAFGPAYFAAAQPNTALDMVQRLPGFSLDVINDVRGFAGAASNVLIDGVRPSAKTDNVRDTLNRIPFASVARIEVIRGGAPGIDMQGRTVIANVVLKSDARTELTEAIALKAFGNGKLAPAGRLEAARREGRKSLSGSLMLFQEQFDDTGEGTLITKDRPDGPLTSRANVRVTQPANGAKARAALQQPLWGGLAHLNFSFDYMAIREDEQDRIIDLTRPASSYDTYSLQSVRSQDRTRTGELGGDYVHPLGPHAEIKLVALQTLTTETYGAHGGSGATEQVFDQLTRSGESIGRVELTWKPGPQLSIESGGEVAFNFLQGATRFTDSGVEVALPSAHVRVEELRGELFSTANWRVSPQLNVEAGLRVESSSLTQSGDATNSASFTFPKPRIAVTWTPNTVDQLRLTVERKVGQLNFSDFSASANLVQGQINGGNAHLEPQRDWRASVAYERKILGNGAIVATYTHAELEQVIDVVPVQGVSAPGNIGDGSRDTWELSITAPLAVIGMKGGQFKTDGTWISSHVVDPTTHQNRAISNDKPFQVEMSLTNDIPSLKSTWSADLFTGVRGQSWRIDQVQGYAYRPWLSLSWDFKPRRGMSIRTELNNVLSRERTLTTQNFAGLRGQSAATSWQQLSVNLPASFYIRFRQTV